MWDFPVPSYTVSDTRKPFRKLDCIALITAQVQAMVPHPVCEVLYVVGDSMQGVISPLTSRKFSRLQFWTVRLAHSMRVSLLFSENQRGSPLSTSGQIPHHGIKHPPSYPSGLVFNGPAHADNTANLDCSPLEGCSSA